VNRRELLILLGYLGLLTLAVAGLYAGELFNPVPSLLLGRDSLAYHLAPRMALAGANPYDAEQFRAWQIGLGYPITEATLYFHYFPASLPLLGVLFQGGYEIAVARWFLLNLFFLAAGGYCTWLAFSRSTINGVGVLVLSLCFLPHLDLLFEGQVGGLLVAALGLTLLLAVRRQHFFSGIVVSILMLKPHLFVPLAAVVLLDAVSRKQLLGVCGFFGALLLTSVATELLMPGVHQEWLQSFAALPEFPRTAALASLFVAEGGSWSSPIVLGMSALGVVGSLLVYRQGSISPWLLGLFPMILSLSVLTAPRLWVSDQSVLVVVQVALVAILSRGRSPSEVLRVTVCFCILQLLCLLAAISGTMRVAENFWWFPFVMLGGVIVVTSYATKRETRR
jgi:hypothetical protein